MTRSGSRIAPLAVAAALLLPASTAAADGPVATKSGAIVNYTSTAKLKVAKQMFIYFTCSVTCDASGSAKIKGPGVKIPINASAQIPAGVQAFMKITVKGALLKLLKAHPGAFKVPNTITATDPSTGAIDSISNTFKFKR